MNTALKTGGHVILHLNSTEQTNVWRGAYRRKVPVFFSEAELVHDEGRLMVFEKKEFL